jgi:hypothetical protein
MLDLEIVSPADIEQAAYLFHRDGFVAVENARNNEQIVLLD